MSRLCLKNSAPAAGLANNVVRRWKSSLHHLKQHQQRILASQGGTTSVCGVSVAGSSPLLSLSSNLRFSTFSSAVTRAKHTIPVIQKSRTMSSKVQEYESCLGECNINQNYIEMQYAVRGLLVIRAGEIVEELKAGKKKPFTEVLFANIGDCHAMGQKPITHVRQFISLCYDNDQFNNPKIPEDVKKRARVFLNGCGGGSAGSYTDSAGIAVVRQQVADYIANRDGFPSNWKTIVLTNGASPAIKGVLALLNQNIDGKIPGIMSPIPQYPLYSATLSEYGMHQIGYYLTESANWGLNVTEMKRAIDEARKVCNPRAIVVINPGNPTGQVLTRKNIEEIIEFAYKEKLVLLADEVYQFNIYDKDSKFHSFKKVMMEMGSPYNQMELVSFNSASKGYLGECGVRGGYMEVVNFCPDVFATFYKSITASLCSTTVGQMAISAMVNPPKKGDASYDLFVKERDGVLGALKERAALVHQQLNSIKGISCNIVQGAMYAFPQIKIPQKAIEEAKKKNLPADTFYALELLETTGICIVPGSGFKQEPGTYHFRTTILPQTDKLKIMLQKLLKFHVQFEEKYT